MNHRELLQVARDVPLSELVSAHVLSGAPVALGGDEQLYDHIRTEFASQISASQGDIRIVGSAKLGYSLSPDTFGVPFSDASDIDIVVVNPALFDDIWWKLSSWRFPWWLSQWPKEELRWGRERVEGVFHGWVEPKRFRFSRLGAQVTPPELRDVRVAWFNALKKLSSIRAIAGHDCHARVYRSWETAARYHEWSFSQVLNRQDHSEG